MPGVVEIVEPSCSGKRLGSGPFGLERIVRIRMTNSAFDQKLKLLDALHVQLEAFGVKYTTKPMMRNVNAIPMRNLKRVADVERCRAAHPLFSRSARASDWTASRRSP